MKQLTNTTIAGLLFCLSFGVTLAHENFPDLTPEQVAEHGFNGVILDVRSPEEFKAGHVPGAINIPHTELSAHLATLGDTAGPLLVYCRSGRRAAMAMDTLSTLGFTDLQHLDGDMLQWETLSFPIEKPGDVNK